MHVPRGDKDSQQEAPLVLEWLLRHRASWPSASRGLNFKELDVHPRRGPWRDLSWNSKQPKIGRGDGLALPCAFGTRVLGGLAETNPPEFWRQSRSPRADFQVEGGVAAQVRGERAAFRFSLPGSVQRRATRRSPRGREAPAGASLGKFSAKLGMGPRRADSRARVQEPEVGSTQVGLDARYRGCPGDPGVGGEPYRGRELTRFLKSRFLLLHLRPSLTSPARGWRARQRPPREEVSFRPGEGAGSPPMVGCGRVSPSST